MLTPLWSARVTSRFTKALPACDVKENAGLKLTMTPQRSTVTGSGFERTVSNSTTPSWDKEMDVKFASGGRGGPPACARSPANPPTRPAT